jgi:hypothetical protein
LKFSWIFFFSVTLFGEAKMLMHKLNQRWNQGHERILATPTTAVSVQILKSNCPLKTPCIGQQQRQSYQGSKIRRFVVLTRGASLMRKSQRENYRPTSHTHLTVNHFTPHHSWLFVLFLQADLELTTRNNLISSKRSRFW